MDFGGCRCAYIQSIYICEYRSLVFFLFCLCFFFSFYLVLSRCFCGVMHFAFGVLVLEQKVSFFFLKSDLVVWPFSWGQW